MVKREGFLQYFLPIILFVILCNTFMQSRTVVATSQVSSAPNVVSLPPTEIIARARVWVVNKVRYNQDPAAIYRYQNYRTDCSGFVSMAWGLLPTPPNYGLDTNGLALVSDLIQKEQLREGDILLNLDPEYNPDPRANDTDWAHAVIFAGWANSAHTIYDAIEENGDFQDGFGFAVEHNIPYPYYPGDYHNIQDYKPMRFDPVKAAKLGVAPTIIPGGQWISPSPKNGSTVTDVLNLAASAYPTHKGDPPISVVYFTVDSLVVCTISPPKLGMTFACTTNLKQLGFSSGQILVSFNVVDQEDNVNLAPNGVHMLTYIPTPEPVPTPTPPPITIPVPPTRTSCPATGTARAAITAPLLQGQHQNIIYVFNQSDNNGNPTSAFLKRYDVTTGSKTVIVQIPNVSISEAQISPDGQWVLFVSQVNGQSAIQMVRMDGQGLQTLHCAPLSQSIYGLSWSPDQTSLAFDEGINVYTSGSSENSLSTYLLQLASGTLQRILIQPKVISQYAFVYYIPSYWIDNSRFYMLEYTESGRDNPLTGLDLLDTKKGENQQGSDLLPITQFSGEFYQGFALSPDRTTLFLSQCSCSFPAGTGPSSLTAQPAGGGTPKTIYTNPNSAIIGVYMISNTRLLLLIGSYANAIVNVDISQNGLWIINTDGTGLQRLTTDTSDEHTIPLNASTQYPWANISRDGTMYAAQIIACTSSPCTSATGTLVFGSLSSNTPTSNITAPTPISLSGSPLAIVGWTIM